MNKLPAAVLGSTLAIGACFAVDGVIERPLHPQYAVADVQRCATILGRIVGQSELLKTCADFTTDFTPTQVTGPVNGDRFISYLLPKPIELINKELPGAVMTDQKIVETNTKNQQQRLLVDGLAGLVIGAVAYGYAGKIPVSRRRQTGRRPDLNEKSSAAVLGETV